MNREPQQEELRQVPGIVAVLDELFLTAYQSQMDGGTPMHEFAGLGGKTEAVGLNPKSHEGQGDNVRFIVAGGSLEFGGFSIDMGDGEIDLKYAVCKITLPPGNTRPIEELFVEEVHMSTMYMVGDNGRVLNGPLWLEQDEIETLSGQLERCIVAPALPKWAQES